MITLKKISAAILGILGVSMVIGAFTSHRGVAYTLFCVLIGVGFLALTFLLMRSANRAKERKDRALENSILKTKIIDASSKKSASSTIVRGVAGGAVGGVAGTVVGASLGKTNRETTFLVLFRDGTKKTITVQNDSPEYQLYCKFLEM